MAIGGQSGVGGDVALCALEGINIAAGATVSGGRFGTANGSVGYAAGGGGCIAIATGGGPGTLMVIGTGGRGIAIGGGVIFSNWEIGEIGAGVDRIDRTDWRKAT
jgi:hypothetical protein